MTKIYPLSVIAVLAMIVLAIVLSGGVVGVFVSFPSMIMVFGITIALTLASHRPSEIRTAFVASHVGAGAAIALITVFYAIVFLLVVVLPYRAAAEKRLASAIGR